jgi:pyruvate dehydrogenase E1 component
LLGSGAILYEVIKAAELLLAQGIGVDVFSVTSWSELARQGQACEAADLAGTATGATGATPFITQQLTMGQGPIIAATDYVRAVPESIRAFVPAGRSYTTLGTDGFGRSDTRSQLRQFFKVDAASIAAAALRRLG